MSIFEFLIFFKQDEAIPFIRFGPLRQFYHQYFSLHPLPNLSPSLAIWFPKPYSSSYTNRFSKIPLSASDPPCFSPIFIIIPLRDLYGMENYSFHIHCFIFLQFQHIFINISSAFPDMPTSF
jgi:hypothetical protein